jgi:hypothetical protein
MDRKQFLGCCALVILDSADADAASAQTVETRPSEAEREKQFVTNWLTDLFDAIDVELDEATKVKLLAGCGRACFSRFSFKQDIARLGKGSVEKLLEAYKKNFEVWQDGGTVHVRYGATNKQCYCPAARYHAAKPNDVHCECTRATHQAIFETALERPVKVSVVESLRRGGKTCQFTADVA